MSSQSSHVPAHPDEREQLPSRRSFLQLSAAVAAAAALMTHESPPAAATTWDSGTPGVLLDETFAFMVTFDPRGPLASGWELRDLAGSTRYAFGTYMRPTDIRSDLSHGLYKTFRRVAGGRLIWDFRFEPITAIDGATFAITSGGSAALTLGVQAGQLVLEPQGAATALGSVASGVHGVRVEIDVDGGAAAVVLDGVQVATGAPVAVGEGLDGVHYRTGTTEGADLYLGPIKVTAGHHLLEDFVTTPPGTRPSRWVTTGDLAVVSAAHARRADNAFARLTGTGPVNARTAVGGIGNAWVFETSFLVGSYPGGLQITATTGTHALRLSVASSQLTVRSAAGTEQQVSFVNYANRIWHHLRVVFNGATAEVWHNGKRRRTGVSLPTSSDAAQVSIDLPGGGTLWFDDVKLYPWLPYPADYVPQPQPVTTGDMLIGVQSCNLWREGYHRGWDVINPHRERTPLLGYYDEGSPEVADWETKWLSENGVAFQMYCWYRPQAGKGAPIKMPRLGMHLHEGFFPSRWSEHQKFIIQWENSGEPTDSADFRQHISTFWLEYYFKDPRYLKVDNRPVLAIYSLAKLVEHFGSQQAARAELDQLELLCVAAGFSGLYVLGNAAGSYPALQLDAEYSYSRKGYADIQRAGMLARRAASDIDVLATISHGRNDLAWNDRWGEYATPETFQAVLEWVRDDFMPTAPSGALSRRIALLDNWNEFGEGHFLLPSELAGFGYLEAVRAVFGERSGPVNTAPTPGQRDRITVLYPDGRVLPDAAPPAPQGEPEVALEWVFDAPGDLQGWSDLHGTLPDLRAEGGALRGTATTNDPVIASPDGLDIAAADHPFIRVRLRTSVTSEQELFFIQPENTTYSKERGLVFHAEPDADGWIDATIPVWQCPTWQGTISQFRIDPMVVAGEFEVASVQVLRVPQPSPHVLVNGSRRRDVTPVVDGADVRVPALALMRVLGRRVEWESLTGTFRVLNGTTVVSAAVGQNTGNAGGEEFALGAAVQIDEHGWPLLPMAFLTGGLGATVTWDGESLSIDVPPPPAATLRVAADGSGDFASVALAAAAVVDSSPQNPYLITVAPGTYTETEWIVPPHTTIRGDDRATCVLAGALPDNATDAEITNTSTLWLKQSATLENLTITARNMRYAIHSEASGGNANAVHVVRNCTVEHSGNDGARQWRREHPEAGMSASTVWSSDRPFGYGSASGLHLQMTDCELIGVKEPWYVHTNKDFTAPTVNVLERCTFTSTGSALASALTVQSLGSGQRDAVTIRDSTFTGVYMRHDDRPWITQRAAGQVSDHAEIAVTLDGCTPLGFRPNLRSRALRLVAVDAAADAPIAVSGSAAPLLFGDPVARAGGGGVASYLYGSWDISGILVGLANDVSVANTIGRRLGNRTGAPVELVVTVGSQTRTHSFDGDLTGVANADLIAALAATLDGLATVDEYDVGLGETYPAVGDKEATAANVGSAGIPRWGVVEQAVDGVRLRSQGAAWGVALEQIAPGATGRVLRTGVLWRQQLAGLQGAEIAEGTSVYLDDAQPGRFALTGSSSVGAAVATDWVAVDFSGVAGPSIAVKPEPEFTVGSAAEGYQRVSFKLHDPSTIDRLLLNGVEKDLVDDTWSDLNFVQVGRFGAVAGLNTLVVFDAAGGSTSLEFTLRTP